MNLFPSTCLTGADCSASLRGTKSVIGKMEKEDSVWNHDKNMMLNLQPGLMKDGNDMMMKTLRVSVDPQWSGAACVSICGCVVVCFVPLMQEVGRMKRKEEERRGKKRKEEDGCWTSDRQTEHFYRSGSGSVDFCLIYDSSSSSCFRSESQKCLSV